MKKQEITAPMEQFTIALDQDSNDSAKKALAVSNQPKQKGAVS